jgi:hypothetical protein
MSQNSTNSDHQEIDLTMISNKINGFFSGIGSSIYRSIEFFKRNLLLTGILFVSGAGLGIYLDSNNETYDSKIIVRPNFGSTEYLYNKIDLLSSKIKNQDTLFLKFIGIKNPKSIKVIEIEPIIDIYSLVNYNEKNVTVTTNTLNFELLKLLAEDSDVNKVIKDKATSKNYYWHTIHIVSKGFATDENTIKPILDYLKTVDYNGGIYKHRWGDALVQGNLLKIFNIPYFILPFPYSKWGVVYEPSQVLLFPRENGNNNIETLIENYVPPTIYNYPTVDVVLIIIFVILMIPVLICFFKKK